MIKILIDADALIGIYSTSDAHHKECQKIIAKNFKKAEWFTTFDVVDEVATKLSYNFGKKLALDFLNDLGRTKTKILYTDTSVFEDAKAVFGGFRSKQVSLTDCINIITCKNEDIDYIFSFDKIYSKAGLKYLK